MWVYSLLRKTRSGSQNFNHNIANVLPLMILFHQFYIPCPPLRNCGQGAGLGNKFLDDLRHADVLMHILDVSGTTNEKGEATVGYDPVNDAKWLHGEIHAWVFNNLWRRWTSVVRRHTATKSSAASTLLGQLSGYGAWDGAGSREPICMLTADTTGGRQP